MFETLLPSMYLGDGDLMKTPTTLVGMDLRFLLDLRLTDPAF